MSTKKSPLKNELALPTLAHFLAAKSAHTHSLFEHFTNEYKKIGSVTIHPLKSMIGVAAPQKKIAYITQFGKNFIHVVFPFQQPYAENLCFQKIAQVPGDANQFNHHFRMLEREDINEEVLGFMKLAYTFGNKALHT
jgi:hypothetical protein